MYSLEEVVRNYKNTVDYNRYIEQIFHYCVQKDERLMLIRQYFRDIGSWGEDSFYWIWYLLIRDLNISKMLEIGCYQGQFPILSKIIAKQMLNKNIECHLVTPFSNAGDKYSNYQNRDYYCDFKKSCLNFGLSADDFIIHKGYSQDREIQKGITKDRFDLIYVDGSHNYEDVVRDIEFYVFGLLKDGGVVIFDDAMCFQPNRGHGFVGHEDVSKAVDELVNCNDDFVNLFNISHNRVFQKVN